MATTTTFDINKMDKERLSSPATWGQVQGIMYRFGKTGFSQSGKTDYRKQSQIKACLWKLVKANKLNFKQAHVLLNAKSFPKVYKDSITQYLADNPETELES
jgi:hypothetical protein